MYSSWRYLQPNGIGRLAAAEGLLWLRGQDLNLRPLGYEPNELPDCSTPRHTRERHDRRLADKVKVARPLVRQFLGLFEPLRQSFLARSPPFRVAPPGPRLRPRESPGIDGRCTRTTLPAPVGWVSTRRWQRKPQGATAWIPRVAGGHRRQPALSCSGSVRDRLKGCTRRLEQAPADPGTGKVGDDD